MDRRTVSSAFLLFATAVSALAQSEAADIARRLSDPRVPRDEKVQAMRELKTFEARARECVDELLALIKGDDEVLGVTAMVTLGTVGPFLDAEDRDLITSEILALHRGKPSYNLHSSFVARALSRLALPADSPTPDLLRALEGRNPYAVESASHLLARRGAEAMPAVPLLAEIVRQPHLPTMGAVGFHDPATGEVVTVTDATDWTKFAQAVSGHLLLRLAPQAPESIPVHLQRLDKDDPNAKLDSLMYLGLMGPDAASAVPRLMVLSEKAAPRISQEAITALGMIGPAARAATPLLGKLTGHENPQIANRARIALRQIGR